MKKSGITFLACALLFALLCPFFCASTYAVEAVDAVKGTSGLKIQATSAVLMEYETGTILYEQNADAPLPPASITKIFYKTDTCHIPRWGI